MVTTSVMASTQTPGSPVRVLIENGNARARAVQAALLRDRDFSVAECGGPDSREGGCPVPDGRGCDLVENTDLVLHDLDLDDPRQAAVFDGLRARYPQLPVVLELPTSRIRRHASRLTGCTVVAPIDADHLVRAIEEGASHVVPD